MEKVRPSCGQPSDRGRLKNRTEQNRTQYRPRVVQELGSTCVWISVLSSIYGQWLKTMFWRNTQLYLYAQCVCTFSPITPDGENNHFPPAGVPASDDGSWRLTRINLVWNSRRNIGKSARVFQRKFSKWFCVWLLTRVLCLGQRSTIRKNVHQ